MACTSLISAKGVQSVFALYSHYSFRCKFQNTVRANINLVFAPGIPVVSFNTCCSLVNDCEISLGDGLTMSKSLMHACTCNHAYKSIDGEVLLGHKPFASKGTVQTQKNSIHILPNRPLPRVHNEYDYHLNLTKCHSRTYQKPWEPVDSSCMDNHVYCALIHLFRLVSLCVKS